MMCACVCLITVAIYISVGSICLFKFSSHFQSNLLRYGCIFVGQKTVDLRVAFYQVVWCCVGVVMCGDGVVMCCVVML